MKIRVFRGYDVAHALYIAQRIEDAGASVFALSQEGADYHVWAKFPDGCTVDFPKVGWRDVIEIEAKGNGGG